MKIILTGLLLIIALLVGAVFLQLNLISRQRSEIVNLTSELEAAEKLSTTVSSKKTNKYYTDYDGHIPDRVPLTGKYVISQKFSKIHKGVDFAAVTGEKIRAAAPGVIVETGSDAVYGKYVVIDHLNGFKTKYAHCSKVFAKEKEYIYGKDIIALVGNTGRSTDPHLHFEIIRDGENIDPLEVIKFDNSL